MIAIEPIEWGAAFELGCREIDADHRIIVDLFNDLARAVQRGASQPTRQGILSTLIRFSLDHAVREAPILRRENDPITAEHVLSHAGLQTQATFIRLNDGEEAALHDLRRSILHGLLLLRPPGSPRPGQAGA